MNPGATAYNWAEYKHVAVKIGTCDEVPPLSVPGYYYLIGLAPAERERLLGISFPSV
jgi:hypothetical protein